VKEENLEEVLEDFLSAHSQVKKVESPIPKATRLRWLREEVVVTVLAARKNL